MRFLSLPILIFIALSVSCSSADKAPPATVAAPVQKTVIDQQLKALDKAKAVQDTVDQQKKDTDKK